ncbi:MAG TPA: hypothetical protein DCP92_14480 [Nitrospiraceae bacterium]|nr:hypothetical protein [Nitrospiraceae bacterium]
MFDRKSIGVLTAVVAALFVMAFAHQAFAFSAGTGTPFTYSGNVIAIDDANRTVTVQAGPNDSIRFNLDEGGLVMRCSMSSSFDDLKIGDWVNVTYFQKGTGPYIASEIDSARYGMQHC